MDEPLSQHDLSRSDVSRSWTHKGRLAESRHEMDAALAAYVNGQSWGEAARILSHLGRFTDAGHAMMLCIPRTPAPVSVLTAEQRRAAMNAALCFARGGARREAVGLLMLLGEYSKAASLLALAGRRQEAVQAMRGEPIAGSPWPQGVLFRLREPLSLVPPGFEHVDDPAEAGRSLDDSWEFGSHAGDESTPLPSETLRGIEPIYELLLGHWEEENLPAEVADELGRHIARGRDSNAETPVQVAWYAIGRLLERAALPRRASAAYAGVPGILDAAFRLQQAEGGRIEASDGQWIAARLLDQGLLLKPAELPDLEGLFKITPATETPQLVESPSTPRPDRSESLAMTQDGPIAALSPVPVRVEVHTPTPVATGGVDAGTVIDGRYRIEEQIGCGGMARVFRTIDMELNEEVALKLFLQLAREGSGLDRFRREMKLSRCLLHPNIVRVLEYGVWNGARYLTMELLHGWDVDGFIAQQEQRRVGVSEGLQLMMQACDGLTAAHSIGVVHRDIKPQNLFVVDAGRRLKVMDFGIAKVVGSSSLSITGVRIGTPRYMSPEQIEGGHVVGPQADLYALGGVMYEMFTGTPPFQDEELMPLLLNQMAETPEPPTARNPDLPTPVEDLVMKLLRKNPADRFADARELRAELLRVWIALERIEPA